MNFSTRFSLVWKLHPIFSFKEKKKGNLFGPPQKCVYQCYSVMIVQPSGTPLKQWQVTEIILDPQQRKRKYPLREIMNAIMYIVKTGCQWRMLPSRPAMKPYMALADKVKKESMKKFDEV